MVVVMVVVTVEVVVVVVVVVVVTEVVTSTCSTVAVVGRREIKQTFLNTSSCFASIPIMPLKWKSCFSLLLLMYSVT